MYNVDREVFKFRVEHNITQLPIDYEFMLALLKEKGYEVKSYIQAGSEISKNGLSKYTHAFNGFTVINGTNATIYIKDDISLNDKVKVLAHELGHIVLKHSYQGILGMANEDITTSDQEKEADAFAIIFLAPPCILNALNVSTVPDIQKTTLLNTCDATKILYKLKNSEMPPSEYEARFVDLFISSKKKKKKIGKRFLLLLLIFGLLILSVNLINGKRQRNTNLQEPEIIQGFHEQNTDTKQTSVEQKKVYVTPSGEKYHLSDCRYVTEKATRMNLEDARNEGYQACKVCEPDET